jgi:DNA-binding transcriptional regulator LsrR (DeoR family)
LLGSEVNRRVSSIRPLPSKKNLVVGVALGEAKVPAMAAALRGGLINGLITDEATAAELLRQ